VNAEFFVLAFTAALNPKLLAVDLLLIENRRPRAMFLCLLIGGITVGLTIGLLDVLVFHLDAIKSQKTVSAGVDLGPGTGSAGCSWWRAWRWGCVRSRTTTGCTAWSRRPGRYRRPGRPCGCPTGSG